MRALLPRIVAADLSPAVLAVAPVAVACGFPSPAQDYYDGPLDLTDMLVDDAAPQGLSEERWIWGLA